MSTVPTTRLRRRDVTLSLLTLALPIMGMTISRMLMGFIDFAMVSQLGTTAQAAISPATTLIFVVSCLGMGIANGVQTFVSQADGFKDIPFAIQRSDDWVMEDVKAARTAYKLQDTRRRLYDAHQLIEKNRKLYDSEFGK